MARFRNSGRNLKWIALGGLLTLSACAPESQNTNPHQITRFDKTVKGVEKQIAAEVQLPGLAKRVTGDPTDPDKVENWFTKGPKEFVEGVDAERAYKELNVNLNAADVIVAVIDSGIDINHEDLKGKIWTNQKELNGVKGVDDDNNGYIDDIYGWNFIGGVDGNGNPTHVNQETLEVTRETVRLKKLKAQLESQGLSLSAKDAALLAKASKELKDSQDEASATIATSQKAIDAIKPSFEVLKLKLNVAIEDLTADLVLAFQASTVEEATARKAILSAFEESKSPSYARLLRRVDYASEALKFNLNENYNPRKEIVKDDPDNFQDIKYGNNDVIGPDASHGTHVAGMIAANRSNAIGIKGVAQSVKIMTLRAVPNGDEEDKDIFLAVRYAVNNGARIINMSFGKAYSPHKGKLDQAFKYAASKGVLLVHAAGNSAQNNDLGGNFPNRYYETPVAGETEVKTWLEIAAASRYNDAKLTADFSNYGKMSVDIFGPGVDVLSTTPGNNYEVFSGTSMASPGVAGVAALVLSQKPSLTGKQLRALLLTSGRNKKQLPVTLPGSLDIVAFGSLSRTGALADAYVALQKIFSGM